MEKNEEKHIVSYDRRTGNSNVRNVITKISSASESKKTIIIPVFNIHEIVEEGIHKGEIKYKEIDTALDVFFLTRVPHLCLVDGKETETYRRIRILARNEDKGDTGIKKQIKEITNHIDQETINWKRKETYSMDEFGNEAHTTDTYEQLIEKAFTWLRDVYFPKHVIQVTSERH